MLRADNRHQDIAKPADNKRIVHLSAISVDYEPDRTLPAASMAAWAEAVVRGWRGDLRGDGLHLAPPLALLHSMLATVYGAAGKTGSGTKKDFHHCPEAGMKVLMLCLYQYK